MKFPSKLEELIRRSQEHYSALLASIAQFEPWIKLNKVVFFPEYTDHSIEHIEKVLATASSLIADAAWEVITPADGAALTLATLLHDCGMHLTVDGFRSLIAEDGEWGAFVGTNDKPWHQLWRDFLGEASRFDGRTLVRIFGDPEPIHRPPTDSMQWTQRDLLLIGEFLRRHHARLAHEIALRGVPGPTNSPIALTGVDPDVANLVGLIARSHGMPLRSAVDHLDKLQAGHLQEYKSVHAVYVMALLRIADYVQVDAERAPGVVLRVSRLRSPISQGEFRAHHAVRNVTNTHADPEALLVQASPDDVVTFLRLKKWLSGIQSELDESWAVLGEVYGRFQHLSELRLVIRRLRSNLDNSEELCRTMPYIPRQASFEAADADLLKLMIRPLYGNRPIVGIRELVQNAVDAVRELTELERGSLSESSIPNNRPGCDVLVSVERDAQGHHWLVVDDHGIGMDEGIICDYFLRAGASYRRSDVWRRTFEDGSQHSKVLRSGRFGVGALAAFLLGEELHVTTRRARLGDNSGIEFRASVDTESIELRWITRPVGTTVRIRISDALAKELAGHEYLGKQGKPSATDWDWYCLAEPRVL